MTQAQAQIRRNELAPAYENAGALYDAASHLEMILDTFSKRGTAALTPQAAIYVRENIVAATLSLSEMTAQLEPFLADGATVPAMVFVPAGGITQ